MPSHIEATERRVASCSTTSFVSSSLAAVPQTPTGAYNATHTPPSADACPFESQSACAKASIRSAHAVWAQVCASPDDLQDRSANPVRRASIVFLLARFVLLAFEQAVSTYNTRVDANGGTNDGSTHMQS